MATFSARRISSDGGPMPRPLLKPFDLRLNRLSVGVILVLVIWPYASRLAWASLYVDDLVRVGFRQTETLRQSLFRPFNEHIAPLFEVVSWIAWQAGGRRLSTAPLAFTIASYLPFLLSLALLDRLVKKETGSAPAALSAVGIFGLSSLAAESVFWFSASSFTWALALTLAAVLAAIEAGEAPGRRGRTLWILVATTASAAAPMFCGLGLLAGPVSALRLWFGSSDGLETRRGSSRFLRVSVSAVPWLGTAAYLASAFRLRAVLAQSVERNLNLGQGLLCVVKAPVDVLLPNLVGLPNLDPFLPTPAAVLLFLGLLTLLMVWAWRSPSSRPLIFVGLALILGGYGLTYPLRASADPAWVLTVQRYHLFPQAGLALIVARAAVFLSRKPRSGPASRGALWISTAIVFALFCVHSPGLKRSSRFYRYPEQVRVLSAMEGLAKAAEGLGLSRSRALAALDPFANAWTPEPRLFNAWNLLPVWPAPAQPARPDDRETLLLAVSPQDREALCGGMDVSKYLIKPTNASDSEGGESGRVVRCSQARPLADPDRFEARGELAFVEFVWPPKSALARFLILPSPAQGEIWWTDGRGRWSPSRSLTWSVAESPEGWALPLRFVPHWSGTEQIQLRLLIRRKGPVALATPRVLR